MIMVECSRGLAKKIFCHGCKKLVCDVEYGVVRQDHFGEIGYRRWFNDCCKYCYWRAESKLRKAKNRARTYSDEKVERRKAIASYWTSRRRSRKLHATPRWANSRKIFEIYLEAAKISRETGVPHSVDHIIPLVHGAVCGLHVQDNLRVISATENARKNNHCEADEYLGEYIGEHIRFTPMRHYVIEHVRRRKAPESPRSKIQ